LRSVFAAKFQQQVPDYCFSWIFFEKCSESTRGFASKAEDCSGEIKGLPRFCQAG